MEAHRGRTLSDHRLLVFGGKDTSYKIPNQVPVVRQAHVAFTNNRTDR